MNENNIQGYTNGYLQGHWMFTRSLILGFYGISRDVRKLAEHP